MIVVDTSVWVDFFNGKVSAHTNSLDRLLGKEDIVVGDLILTEVLQGFRDEAQFREAKRLFEAFRIDSMVGKELAIEAAKNYRSLRQQGLTVRKTIDVMIATYCIHHKIPLLYSDRDFDPIVAHLGLKTVPLIP
ncbi:MAG: PIN domain nuclease [Nitrospirae bacterium]|nr:PIN domain nuclease [Nitrospirota bacterium]MDA1304124.1 PIN domain nuclease [Nitrospirota bacterium]